MNPKKKILIIDDEIDLCEVLGEKLKREGFDIFLAHSGSEGLNKAIQVEPDLILLDIIMPDINGLLLLERIREYNWGKKAKVIVLSALSDSENQKRAEKQGALHYLVKTKVRIDDVVRLAKETLP